MGVSIGDAVAVAVAEAVDVAVGVGSSARAGIPSTAAAATALRRAAERIRRVTSLSVSAPAGSCLSVRGGVQTRSRGFLTFDLSLRSWEMDRLMVVDVAALDIRIAVPDDA